jgi:hypothetical protein
MEAGNCLKLSDRARKMWCAIACCTALVAAVTVTPRVDAGCQCGKTWPHIFCREHGQYHNIGPGDISNVDTGGAWYWMRSPEQEKRVVMSIFNRYCVRCHGVDGRGVWDIPDVPDFTNLTWQATRSDAYRTRVILEGRGAVMPSFRGTLTVEESCAMARYLHTFVPGSEVSRPELGVTGTASTPAGSPAAVKPAARPIVPPPVTLPPGSPSPFSR